MRLRAVSFVLGFVAASWAGGAVLAQMAEDRATPPAPVAEDADPVQVRQVKVRGENKPVLTDARGFALYYFTLDTARQLACRDRCLELWKPLTVDGPLPEKIGDLPGTFTTIAGPSGARVVVYDGHPLYTYTGDQVAGRAAGEGRGGKWFVATPDLGRPEPGA